MSDKQLATKEFDLNAIMAAGSTPNKKEIEAETESKSFVPTLSISSSQTTEVARGNLAPGFFILGGTTQLAKEVLLVVITSRLHCQLVKEKGTGFGEARYHYEKDPRKPWENELYYGFKKRNEENPPDGWYLNIGQDFLCYLPDYDKVANFQMMNRSLSRQASNLHNMTEGGIAVKVATEFWENQAKGSKGYSIKISETGRGVKHVKGPECIRDIEIPMEKVSPMFQIFLKEIENQGKNEVVPVSDGDHETGRAR